VLMCGYRHLSGQRSRVQCALIKQLVAQMGLIRCSDRGLRLYA